jgi:chromosome segregation ATPase
MSDEDVTELQDWLVRTLKESHEASPDTALTDIDEVLANIVADGDPEQDEAAQSVINDLQGQVESASEEVESLRAELETTQEELEAARMSDDDTFEEDLEDAKAELERVRGMLSIARDVISSQSTVEVDDAKQKAVDEAINEVAGLEDFRSALEKAVDADAVIELAEELLPAVAAKRQAARNSVTPPKPVVSRALPARGMVVESDVSGGPQRQGVNPSRGARMAGGAVRKMAAPSS